MRYVIWPIVLLAIAASGFTGWYLAQSNQSAAEAAQSEAEEYVRWARNLRLVPVTFAITAPEGTPADQTLFLSGSAPTLQAWEAAGVPLTRQPDGRFTATVELMTGLQHQFKVTRGNWATVEASEERKEIANRSFTIDPDKEEGKVEAQVARWFDDGKTVPGRITLTGNIRQHPKFPSEELRNAQSPNERDIIVYLPPGYDDEANADKRYPVLYMHDGQNLMNEQTSYQGIEWKVDETAERLIKEGKIPPAIIVGVYNTEWRTQEFTPGTMGSADKPGKAELYGKLIVEQIKPMIDSTYRTQPDPQHTYLAGSSLGGLVTLNMLKQFPDKFGGAAVLTPWLALNDKPISAAIGDDLSFLKGKRLWIDMGDKPTDNYPAGRDPMADAKAFVAQLTAAGLKPDVDFVYREFPGTTHNEPSWQARFDQVLPVLLPK